MVGSPIVYLRKCKTNNNMAAGAKLAVLLTLTAAAVVVVSLDPHGDALSLIHPADSVDSDRESSTGKGWLVTAMVDGCERIRALGSLGVLVYAAFLAGAIVIGAPSTVLEIIPGFLFGWKIGCAVAVVGKFVGSMVSVLLASKF
jgi:hypothetical protein